MHQGLEATEDRMTEYECRGRWNQDTEPKQTMQWQSPTHHGGMCPLPDAGHDQHGRQVCICLTLLQSEAPNGEPSLQQPDARTNMMSARHLNAMDTNKS